MRVVASAPMGTPGRAFGSNPLRGRRLRLLSRCHTLAELVNKSCFLHGDRHQGASLIGRTPNTRQQNTAHLLYQMPWPIF